MSDVRTEAPEARYSYGGDEYVFVELAEAMSLKVNFRAMAITNRLREENLVHGAHRPRRVAPG
jgi:urea carboxylase